MSGNTVTTSGETGPSVLTAVDEYLHGHFLPVFERGWQHHLDNATHSLYDIANPDTRKDEMVAKHTEAGNYADHVFMGDPGYVRAFSGLSEEQRRYAMRGMVEECDRDARASVIFEAALSLAEKKAFDHGIPELVRSLRPSQYQQANLALRGAEEFAASLKAYRDKGEERTAREAAYESLLESVSGHGNQTIHATVKTTLAVRELLDTIDLTSTRLMIRDAQKVGLAKNEMPPKTARTPEQRAIVKCLTDAVKIRWAEAVTKGSPNADQLERTLVYLGAQRKAPTATTIAPRDNYVPNEFGPTAVHLPGSSTAPSKIRRVAKWGALGALAGSVGNLLQSAAAVAEPITPAVGQHSIDAQATANPLSIDAIRQQLGRIPHGETMDAVPLSTLPAPTQPAPNAQQNQGFLDTSQNVHQDATVTVGASNEQTTAAVNIPDDEDFVPIPLQPLDVSTLPQLSSDATVAAPATFGDVNTGQATHGNATSNTAVPQTHHANAPQSHAEQVVVDAPAPVGPAAGMVAVQNVMTDQSLAQEDFDQSLEDNSLSFQQLLGKYESTVMQADTTQYKLAENPAYLQSTLTQIEGLYASIIDPRRPRLRKTKSEHRMQHLLH